MSGFLIDTGVQSEYNRPGGPDPRRATSLNAPAACFSTSQAYGEGA